MANNIKKHQNEREIPNIYNTQFNLLMENEFNAISKMRPEYADKAFELLNKTIDFRNANDKEIIELEKRNLKISEDDNRRFYFWSGFGMVVASIISTTALVGGIILGVNGYNTESIIAFLVAAFNIAPKFIQSFKKSIK